MLAVGIGLLILEGITLIERASARSHVPEWMMQADPTDDDFARAREIIETANAEVHILPQGGDILREDAALRLAVAEGLSNIYDTARRTRAISPDALNRADDIEYYAWRAARHRSCDDGGCDEEFSQSDYDAALVSYTARALAAPREPRDAAKRSPSTGFFERLWDWL